MDKLLLSIKQRLGLVCNLGRNVKNAILTSTLICVTLRVTQIRVLD